MRVKSLMKMATPMAKIKQVFKVEKLNPRQEETINPFTHIKLNKKIHLLILSQSSKISKL